MINIRKRQSLSLALIYLLPMYFFVLCNFSYGQELEVEGDLRVLGKVIFEDESQIQTAPSIIPTGIILPFAGSEIPAGWLLCDGGEVSRDTYNSLFSLISNIYGDGDGVTTFNVPDLRGRMPMGLDNMGGVSAGIVENQEADNLGGNSGTEMHQLSIEEMPNHNHDLREYAGSGGTFGRGITSGNDQYGYNLSTSKISSAGGDQPHNNMPPYLSLNYIIKF